ncbi:alpha/beta hydrolase [Lactobacillus sp. PV037]|uniref:alpha/beta hydrolase n=1 Tax=unclassified Lactobacillus TaxID=2620435 RepID=UPI00223F10CD|nr:MULTISPECIES: alpha/beta hydrolase [unclassified Lactobacillus]QNQ82331.1 alpha/beta hydrolase [Lactobacillus sp. PV012]QNQ83557.1 alpha/beta hydrolase [Lactobacillus sp. PV037]
MKKKFSLILSLAILLLVITGCGKNTGAKPNVKQKLTLTNTSSIPTFFFHGYGSSANAEHQMTNAALKADVTHTVIRANVSADGKVSFNKTMAKSTKNPIVEVNLEDNRSGNVSYVKDVIVAFEQKYHYQKINLVGHSMGNLMIANYIKDNYNNKNLPQINKVVSIAGHYNGYLGEEVGRKAKIKNKQTGEPDEYAESFKNLLSLRKTYPKNSQVLNIYGDKKDGSKSDGSVSVASAQSYKYLINGRAKSYKEIEITGKNAQHSKLHENKEVDKYLINFLWK